MRADVAVEVADDEVELRGGEAEPGHRVQDTRHCRAMAGGDDAARRRADLAARHRAVGRRARPRARCVDAGRRGAPGARRRARDDAARARRLGRARVRVAIARRRRSSPTRRCSTRSAIPTTSRASARVDGYRAVVARPRTRRRRGGAPRGGSDASSCASRRATCSASPTCPTVGRELAALAEVCLEAALAIVEPDTPVRGHRDGQARRARAQLRERRRRAVRPRRRRRRAPSAPRARVLATMTTPTERRHRVPHRRRPAARRPAAGR